MIPPTLPAADFFLCENLAVQSAMAMQGSGGIGNAVRDTVAGSTYCRIIVRDTEVVTSLLEIGVPDIARRGVVQAVDVFGLLPDGTSVGQFTSPVTLCLRGSGAPIFLSSEYSVRTPFTLPLLPNSPVGYTCVSIAASGTVVLVGDRVMSAPPATAPGASGGTPPSQECRNAFGGLTQTPGWVGIMLNTLLTVLAGSC